MLALYSSTATSFSNLGKGVLKDFISDPIITEELNGSYILEFEYAKGGYLAEEIVEGAIIRANEQPFRIWNIKKDMNKIVILAKHIFFDLSTNFLEDVAPTNLSAQGALEWILSKAQHTNNFIVNGNCSKTFSARYIRKHVTDAIYNEDNSILKRFGGELELDKYSVYVHQRRGSNTNFSIRYKKNLRGIEFNLDFSTIATRIMPQGNNELLLDEKYIDSPKINNYFTPFYKKIEFSDIGVSEDTTAEEAKELLRKEVNKLYENGIDSPTISIKIDFVELSKCEEYKQYSNLEYCHLGDTIKAIVPELNLNLETRIVKTIYNCKLERFVTLELGTITPDFVSNQIKTENKIQNEVSKINIPSILSQAQQNAENLINHPFKGNLFIDETTGVLYLMDTNNPSTAKNVWKWSLGGLGFSSTGVNGTYTIAITQDGSIVADFITAGKINTNLIEGYNELVTSVSNSTKKIKTIEEILEHFSVDLDIYNITISTNQDRYPLEDKDYYVNYSCLFEGTEVNVTPVIDNNNPGINAVIESGKLKISVYSTKVIESLNNEITLTFIYKNNDDTYALNKKININLALQGAQGEQGEKGETGATGEQGIQGEPGKDAEQPLSVKSASGKEITIEDGKYLKGLSIDGNSYQETRDGYNKLNIPNFVVDSEKGVITTGQDGIISQTGSASEFITVNIVRGAEQPILPAGTYTIYLGDRQADAYYYTYDENGEQLERKYFYYGKKSLVLTIDTSFKIDLITIYCTKELEYPELVYPMLLSGKYTDNTLPNFEKFGASPSPDFPSEIETLEYKNYLNVPSKLEVNVYKTLTDITIPAGNYILKASKITSTASTFTSLIFFYKNDTLIFQTYIGGTQSITQNVVLSSDINKIMIYSGSSYNDSVNTTTTFKELMIAKTSFPYIPFNNNAVAVKINSKNLVKPAKIDTLGYGGITCKTNEDGSFTFSGTATQNVGINLADLTSSPIILKDGKTYTQKLFLMSGDGNFSVVPYVDDIEGNRTYNYFSSTIKAPTQSKVTQGEKIVKGYNIYIGAGSSANVTFKIQLEESAEATEFEPYKEPITITLDLQGNFVGKVDDIKDRLYIENEHLYLEKKIGKVDLSELTWTNTMTNFWVSKSLSNSNIKYASSNEIVGNGLAKKYKMSMGSGMSGSDRLNCIAIDTSQISVNTDKIEITGMFYYELAEPYIVDLGKITIPLHEGYNHIELLSNLETEMSLEYQTLFAGDKAIPHIKYSQDGETFTAADDEYDWGEKPSAYYGIYYDYKLEDSTNFEDYKWYKFTEDIDKDLIEMQNKINNNSTSINNNYQELNDKLNDKASVENVVEVSKKVETLQTSTTYTINVLEDIQVNGVTKVDTGTGFTFDKNGMKVDKTGAPTGGRFDEAGVEIVDKLTAALNTLFYSGYVDEEMATKVAALTKYLGQTVTYSNSLIFQKYLSSGNARFEDIQHDIFGKGIGIFTIGGDE